MENKPYTVLPHPQLLDFLFAFKGKVSAVFKDILGIYEIHHFAVTKINKYNQIISLSSTPALEYNLFSSPLWSYDRSYNPQWFNLGSQAYWHDLYKPKRYDELYYLKQIRHRLPIGLSLATEVNEGTLIYSLASRKSCLHTWELFANQHNDFYKIGQYCANILSPLFNECDEYRDAMGF